MRVMVQPVSRGAHLAKIVAVITGGRFLFGPLTHNMQFLPAQLGDLGEGLFEVHLLPL